MNTKTVIHQYGSTLTLMGMVLDGDMTTTEMLTQGQWGIGVENNLASEFVVVDGKIYTIDVNGNIEKANSDNLASYMTMWDFKPEKTIQLDVNSYAELDELLKKEMSSRNSFYTYLIKGEFEYLEMASAVEYNGTETLVENRARRVMYENHHINGIMVGHYTPEHAAAICFPGMHFHFLADDLSVGGHLEKIKARNLTVEIQKVDKLSFELPLRSEMATANMTSALLPPSTP